MRDAPVPDITPPTRGEALAPAFPKRPQPQKGRFGTMMLGLSTGLGLGLAGGLNLHRLVDLDHTAAWAQQTQTFLQSGFDAARQEVASRINGLMSRPASVVGVAEPTPWTAPSSNETVVQRLGDLSRQVDQVRAGFEVSARDVAQAVERVRSSVEENQRELVAKLAQLTERVEQVERQSVPTASPVKTQPIVQPTPAALAKPVAKPARKPAPEPKAKVAARQTLPEAKPSVSAKGIANWSVREVFDDTAVLDGPEGPIAVGPGDSIPGLGHIQAIMRSGGRWVVATTKGVIKTPMREQSPDTSVNAW
jgi:hypothetical protein